MKNIIPKTYNEVIRKKRCYDLAKYYFVSNEQLVEIYNFLSENAKNRISAGKSMIAFYDENGKMVKNISARPRLSSFDGINMSNSGFVVIQHYTSSGSSSGGSSSNNNNKNNNNNNG